MKTILAVVVLMFISACGEEPSSPSTEATAAASTPGECVTCLHGCGGDLCTLCKIRVAQFTPRVAIAGCLPGGTWCSDPTAASCVIQDCSTCP